ncbi:MAG: glycoside hydrolase family 127 protein [Planctomycetes bacterium]|nr:glycoside hydrolase family 127 protein [Planctomycetota bacterium]
MKNNATACIGAVTLVSAGLAAALLSAGPSGGSEEDAKVVTLSVPPSEGQNDFYVSNRRPLLPNPLIKLPAGAVEARGWLRQQLLLMAEGMFGHLPELSRWCKPENSAWLHPRGEGVNGWEELPYWLKGFGDLGYILKDKRIIDEARRWIEGALGSQQPDGWFGPLENKKNHDLWPNMVLLDALKSYYEAAGDPRVIPFMARYFKWQLELPREHLLPGSWQKIRGADNLASIYWLYNRTGEPWLLDLAKVVHERTADWTNGIASWHGVNICQSFRGPAQYYQQSLDRRHLEATERNYRTVMDLYGQVPGGMFGADENCRQGYTGPRQGAEACSMVEFMLSDEILLGITGDPLYADRCEEVAFNSLPAALAPDLKGLHYLTAPNLVQLDQENKAPGFENGGCMVAYSPGERYRCCQHNVSHGWPYFTEHLWMATRGNGLAAALYAPCAVEAKVGGGATARIAESTRYPFGDRVDFSIQLDRPARFPLLLRIPGWCREARAFVNDSPAAERPRPSSYLVLERTWKDGDRVRLQLPMEIRVRAWARQKNAVSVDRGPLTYSLRIGERWSKFGGTDRWPELEVYPTVPWNYALVIDAKDPPRSFKVVESSGDMPPQPFALEAAPVKLQARGRRIPAWEMEGGLVGHLQGSPVRTGEPEEEIALIPMGCARLRIAVFPVYGEGPDAREWVKPAPPPLTASHLHDDITALNDGLLPKSSNDQGIPRFTWWDHRGSIEWVAWKFEKPRKISRSEVYWFDDTGTGHCRVPRSWKLLWKDGEAWREVSQATGYGVAPDRFNAVAFEPITTAEVRLEAELQKDFSGGILEWRVE